MEEYEVKRLKREGKREGGGRENRRKEGGEKSRRKMEENPGEGEEEIGKGGK